MRTFFVTLALLILIAACVEPIPVGDEPNGTISEGEEPVDTEIPKNAFRGDYYHGRAFETFVASRTDSSVNFDWGEGAPLDGMNVDDFSIRWTGRFDFEEGDYTFTATVDDGIRIYIDGTLVLESWRNQPVATYEEIVPIAGGEREVVIEYYEAFAPASIQVRWERFRAEPHTGLVEAEDASITGGFTLGSSAAASQGAYLEASAVGSGAATAQIPFSVSAPETYALWARLYAPSLNEDAIYIGIDSTLNRVYPASTGAYVWTFIGSYDLVDTHEVHLGPAETGARVDALAITPYDLNAQELDALIDVETPPVEPTDPDPCTDCNAHEQLLDELVGFGEGTLGGKGGEVYTVTSLADSGAGTLRDALTRAEPLWIRFGVSGTINLNAPIQSASYKTIDGRGADVTIARHGVYITGKQHVIITNMKFSRPSDDAIRIYNGARNVWVHHNDITAGWVYPDSPVGDGAIDATEDSTAITISYNHIFDWDKSMLVGGSCDDYTECDGRTFRGTFHHNRYDNVRQRLPMLRHGWAHSYNNLFNWYGGTALDAHTAPAQLYSENDIFEPLSGVDNKVIASASGTFVRIDGAYEKPFGTSLSLNERNPDSVFDPNEHYRYTADPANAQLEAYLEANTGWRNVPWPE